MTRGVRMSDLSNKSLAVFLLAVMVISLGGTFLVLNRIGSSSITGYASSVSGTVNLSVSQSVSITTTDGNLVNFGTCLPSSGNGVTTNVTSDVLEQTGTACTGFTQSNISVRNDGNVNASVTINASAVGKADNASGAFLSSTSAKSSLMYKSTNAGRLTNLGGCTGGTVGSYAPFTQAGYGYPICTNLRTGPVGGDNSLVVDFKIVVPNDAPTGAASSTIGFVAVASSTP